MKSCKEYLEKHPDGTYALVLRSDLCKESDILIPEGAECLTKCKDHNGDEWLLFWKGDYKFCVGHDKEWFYFESGVGEYLNDWCGLAKIIWQRDQDEPFLTPECTLNDQYAEIEQVRQVEIHGTVKAEPDFNFGAAQVSGGVDATLAERQSTYGNFEDVAFVTENIMSILAKVRVNGLNDLPNTHRMALYMIASKMARIVNGDFNHLDSWHDIGGYAKLIEKLIKGE